MNTARDLVAAQGGQCFFSAALVEISSSFNVLPRLSVMHIEYFDKRINLGNSENLSFLSHSQRAFPYRSQSTWLIAFAWLPEALTRVAA